MFPVCKTRHSFEWGHDRLSKNTLYLDIQLYNLLLTATTTVDSKSHLRGIFIVLSLFKGLLRQQNVPLIESTANPHLQFDISYSCTVNPMKLSLIPYIDLTQPLRGEIQHRSVMGTCVWVCAGMWMYSICGVVLGHVGLGLCGVWPHALGWLHSEDRPPLSSPSIRTFAAASMRSRRSNGA